MAEQRDRDPADVLRRLLAQRDKIPTTVQDPRTFAQQWLRPMLVDLIYIVHHIAHAQGAQGEVVAQALHLSQRAIMGDLVPALFEPITRLVGSLAARLAPEDEAWVILSEIGGLLTDAGLPSIFGEDDGDEGEDEALPEAAATPPGALVITGVEGASQVLAPNAFPSSGTHAGAGPAQPDAAAQSSVIQRYQATATALPQAVPAQPPADIDAEFVEEARVTVPVMPTDSTSPLSEG